MCTTTGKIESVLEDLEDGVYIVQKGTIITLTPKSHGHDTLLWKNGEVLDVERSERIRIKS